MEKEKLKKIFNVLLNVVKVILVVMLVLFILMVCLQRFSGNKVAFFNLRMFTVASGSMEPKYVIGDVLISKEVKASEVKIGDTISYLGEKSDFKGKVITHQVVSIETDNDGKYLFHTKGLANIVEDPIVTENQLYGVVIYKCLLLSLIYKVVGTSTGLFVFVVLPMLYIIGSEFVSFLLDKEEKRRNDLDD